MKTHVALICLLIMTSCTSDHKSQLSGIWTITAPAQTEFTQINQDGTTVIPNGRFISPAGKTLITAPHPYGLALSPDNNIAVTANSGTNPLSITIIRDLLTDEPEVQQVPPGPSTERGVLASVFMGLAISPDNQTVYVSGGQENKIYLFDLGNGDKLGSIDCSDITDDADYSHGYIGDLVLSGDGRTLYAVDQIGFRMLIIDTESRLLLHSVPVGRYPFGICLAPDESKVYVANVGMFQYSLIRESAAKSAQVKSIDYPAFAYGSEEMRGGIENDTISIQGLGDPNAIEAFSVFVIDLSDAANPVVSARIKTGHLVGSLIDDIPAVGGSSPNSMVATGDYVFVSNGNNDNISVISVDKDTVISTIYLKPDPRVAQFRGIIPFGIALSPDQKKVYVAESGINAMAVIDVKKLEVSGHIPTGWFPSKVKVTSDGKYLVVANAKGYGSGPNGGASFTAGPEGSYIGSLMKGSLQVIRIPGKKQLKKYTQKVISNNYRFNKADESDDRGQLENPVPAFPGAKVSPIRHIVFISKENRTYDEIFGQVEEGEGDPSLARYGRNARIFRGDGKTDISNLTVMPNHLNIASRFSMSDNFYVDSDVSADGHRWLVNTYPNEWCETSTAASYGGNRNFRSQSKSPGVYAMNGAAGAIYPEDYNEAGSMWDHLERNGVDFYNFGFSIMFEPALYKAEYKYSGIQQYINYPMPQPLYDRTSRSYPTYNMAIPDQFRIDQFIKEFDEKWIHGPDSMPALITVIIPNDHGAADRPEAGYPFRESYMADNDLALGRIVEYLSHTPYWNEMLIVITEDDAQNGVDHIDAHRSLLLLASPWVKKNYVSHYHYSFGSIFKTFWNILGLPYLNQYDACANDLSDHFTSEPDLTPYDAVDVDQRIFSPQKALDPFDETFNWKSLEDSPQIDNVEDMYRESKEQDEYRLENREKKVQYKQ